MKWSAALLLIATAALSAERPRVSREALALVEQNTDKTIRGLDINDPYDLLGFTRGVYLPGYGLVMTTEVNLVITPITPFHQPPVGPQVTRLHDKKVARLAFIRQMMREVMIASASALDGIPADERIVFGLTLFYRSFEQRDGLPGQIIMQAPRHVLLDFKASRIDRAQLDAAIQVQEL